MSRLKLALVGCGEFSYQTLFPMLRNQPIELVAICDTDSAKMQRFSQYYQVVSQYADYKEMIQKETLDVVICVVNAKTHYEVAKLCLESGIHVFVEKTPCETTKQAQELSALQKVSNKLMGVGFNRRFTNSYILAKEIIGRPEFGEVAMFYSKFNASRYGSIDYFIFNHIIHHIDLARYLIGELCDITVKKKVVNDQSGAFIVDFTAVESGALGTIQCACMLEEAYPMERLDIVSTGGNVVVDNLRSLQYNRTAPARDRNSAIPLTNGSDCLTWNLSNGYGVGSGIFSYLGFEIELQEFIAAVIGKSGEFRCSIDKCIGTMEAMEIVRSACM